MKRKIILLSLLITSAASSFAQDANEILKRYLKETKIETIANAEKLCFMMETDATTKAAGQTIEAKSKIIMSNPDGKFRIETNAAGNDILMVSDGTNGWMLVQGTVQDIPADQIKQMKEQNNSISNYTYADYNLKFVESKDGQDIIKATHKTLDGVEMLIAFDKGTGLISTTTTDTNGMKIVSKCLNYKDFNGIKMPEKMEVETNGKPTSTIIINDFNANYKPDESTFAKPEGSSGGGIKGFGGMKLLPKKKK